MFLGLLGTCWARGCTVGQLGCALEALPAQPENEGRTSRMPSPLRFPVISHGNPRMAIRTPRTMQALFCKYRSNQIPRKKRRLLRSTLLISNEIQPIKIPLRRKLKQDAICNAEGQTTPVTPSPAFPPLARQGQVKGGDAHGCTHGWGTKYVNPAP